MPPKAERKNRKELRMNKSYHRIHIRMTKAQYESLKDKSEAAGMSMNKYLAQELERNSPMPFPAKEMRELSST